MTHKGWCVVKAQHNQQSKTLIKCSILRFLIWISLLKMLNYLFYFDCTESSMNLNNTYFKVGLLGLVVICGGGSPTCKGNKPGPQW